MKNDTSIYDINFSFYSWTEYRDDYKLIAELLPKSQNSGALLSRLAKVNEKLKGKKFIFDGTITSAKWLIDNKLLNLNDLEDKELTQLFHKHLYQRSKTKEITLNPDRHSSQAFACKCTTVGLYLYAGKLQISRNSTKTIEIFENLKETDIWFDLDKKGNWHPNPEYETGINAIWVSFMGNQPWSKERTKSIREFMVDKTLEIFMEGSDMEVVAGSLEKYTEEIARKYFPDYPDKDDVFAAIRLASTVTIFKSSDHTPEGGRHPTIRVDGFLNKFMEYIFDEKYNLQEWFVNYYKTEFERRVRLLRRFFEIGIRYYLPVIDNFTFLGENDLPAIAGTLALFRNRNVPTKEKDDIAKAVVLNVQKLFDNYQKLRGKDPHEREKVKVRIKDMLTVFLLAMLYPLRQRVLSEQKVRSKKEPEEIFHLINEKTIDAILKYDESKNSSFFGYIKTILPLETRSDLREKVTETKTDIGLPEELEDITRETLEEEVSAELLKETVSKVVDSLPKKEREAIQKTFFKNENLTDTERKAKNRGLEKIRQNHPELKDWL